MEKQSSDKLICIKAGFFFVILFFWASGVALICLGATVQMKLSDVSVVIAETSSGAPLALTILGMVIFFLSGFGAVAVIKENSLLIKIFTGVMLLVFAIEIIVGISAYSYRDMLQRDVLQRFMKMLDRYGKDKSISRGLDGVQQEFQCCGARNYTDWFRNVSSAASPDSVPPSCCKTIRPKCGENAEATCVLLVLQGCVLKMQMWISDHVEVIGAVGVGLGFSQIFGILFSCLLVKILQENYVSM
ncbi:PREDICTED: CD151 antigen-like [Nanorana parkeri]|uniref:CD151 antigen-like n=1 Tax=Nanorana parkeri TaxID=125878 RepID=UPI00085434E1|nr:PREDICTED: CD151 antigen-like [Nanorana parkeri]